MIDIKIIRETPEIIKKNCKNRGYDINVDEILELDVQWRKLKTEDDALRGERNKISESINQAKKDKKPIEAILAKAKEIPLKLAENEKKENESI
jgi:seryl-tRNA synthetase